MTNDERDILLLGMQRDMCWIKKILSNHLDHHSRWSLTMAAITGSAIIALVVLCLKTL